MATVNAAANVLKLVEDNGSLPAYAWPGGYPMFYVDDENNVLCPKCANENDEFSAPITAYDINYEDDLLFCDHCSERIEDAYKSV